MEKVKTPSGKSPALVIALKQVGALVHCLEVADEYGRTALPVPCPLFCPWLLKEEELGDREASEKIHAQGRDSENGSSKQFRGAE